MIVYHKKLKLNNKCKGNFSMFNSPKEKKECEKKNESFRIF